MAIEKNINFISVKNHSMAQVKIYALRETLTPIKKELSDIIHECVVTSLKFPVNKRAHRFINLDKEDFFYPEGRTDNYIIIEFLMIEGRSVETKKNLTKMIFKEVSQKLKISTTDIEVCIIESAAHNWGFRGQTGDEVSIDYKINV
jgi:5-carboxymethyl-2-hydroxymuconate isomerase